MSHFVQRFLLKACPSPDHPKYYPWTVAEVCVLIGDDDNTNAFEKAKSIIKKNHWIPISGIHRSTLIERLILSESQQAIDIYNDAKKGNNFFDVTTENWTGFKNRPPVLFPKITEPFMDKVFELAGGSRYHYDEKKEQLNADYLLGGYIFELKILEEERLLNDLVQTKIAKMYRQDGSIGQVIDAQDFAANAYSSYINIFRSPIQNAVKSASKQITSTKVLLKDNQLKGGLIIINNGTSSITPKIFYDCVQKSIKNNTSNIDTHLAISNWSKTDGFNTSFNFSTYPELKDSTVALLTLSYKKMIHSFLTDWMRYGMSNDVELIKPLQPLAFERYGIVFSTAGSFEQKDV